jgi:hypothetical protein
LRALNYVYPSELVPAGLDAAGHLRELTFAGANRRWPGGIPAGITAQLEFNIDAGGMVGAQPAILSDTNDPLARALASAAQRAVMRCGPYTVSAGQQVRATFDPSQF